MEDELEKYLRDNRKIDDGIINKMKDQKIDISTISLMDDAALSEFLECSGDRYQVRNFCKHFCSDGNASPEKETFAIKLKKKLYGLIKDGKDIKNQSNLNEPSTSRSGESVKPTRKISIGWICDGTHVRINKGGGCREVDALKTHKKADLLKIALDLFFPNGVSVNGPLTKFTYDLYDYLCHSFDENLTVDNIYKITGLTRIRFYLTTSSVMKTGSADDKEEGKSNGKGKGKGKGKWKGKSKASKVKNKGKYVEETSSSDSEAGKCTEERVTRSKKCRVEAESNLEEFLIIKDHSSLNYDTTGNGKTEKKTQITDEVSPDSPTHSTVSNIGLEVVKTSTEDFLLVEDYSAFQFCAEDVFENTNPILIGSSSPNTYKIVLHRGQVFNELINEFLTIESDANFYYEVEMYSYLGTKEAAYDAGGVLKDALSEFWLTFYEGCCEGTLYKIPIIRHDFDKCKWQAVAKIIYMGYKQVHYFPSRIARIFMEQVFFGGSQIDLIESLLEHLPACDSLILKNALNNFTLVDDDDLIEVLTNLECKKRVTDTNLRTIITEIAHAQLIQKSMFIIDSWRTVLPSKMTKSELENIYVTKKVTTKNVLKMIEADTTTSKEEETLGFLKKYIKELNDETLEKFLRFCTGANMIADGSITVTFNTVTGAARRPESKTCNCLLMLSVTYDTFTEFRSEFNCVLNSNEWEMEGF